MSVFLKISHLYEILKFAINENKSYLPTPGKFKQPFVATRKLNLLHGRGLKKKAFA
jgi:hypothetical protein